jgi:hypothetical protein
LIVLQRSREVVATRADVIFAVANDATLALKSETHTIPIVAWTGDPVGKAPIETMPVAMTNAKEVGSRWSTEIFGTEGILMPSQNGIGRLHQVLPVSALILD